MTEWECCTCCGFEISEPYIRGGLPFCDCECFEEWEKDRDDYRLERFGIGPEQED